MLVELASTWGHDWRILRYSNSLVVQHKPWADLDCWLSWEVPALDVEDMYPEVVLSICTRAHDWILRYRRGWDDKPPADQSGSGVGSPPYPT